MSIAEVMTGKGAYYPGLIPLCHAYLDFIQCDRETRAKVCRYICEYACVCLLTSGRRGPRYVDTYVCMPVFVGVCTGTSLHASVGHLLHGSARALAPTHRTAPTRPSHQTPLPNPLTPPSPPPTVGGQVSQDHDQHQNLPPSPPLQCRCASVSR